MNKCFCRSGFICTYHLELKELQSTSTPVRVQRKRVKGWKMPENTKCVTRPGKFGNPFMVGERSRIDAFMEFQDNLKTKKIPYPSIDEIKKELKGKNLACFCPLGELCHADILLKIANS